MTFLVALCLIVFGNWKEISLDLLIIVYLVPMFNIFNYLANFKKRRACEANWEKGENGKYIRTIVQIDKLYDVSPVYYPAYEDTEVALRSIESIRDKERKDLEDRQNKEKEEREKREKEDLEIYYNNLKNRF